LASLIAEADKFTTQLTELAGGPARAEQDLAPAEPSGEAAPHAESLLAEAADAIAAKPVEPEEVEHVEEPWLEETAAIQDLPPPIRATGPRRDSTMLLSPTDIARITVQRQQRRIGRCLALRPRSPAATAAADRRAGTGRMEPVRKNPRRARDPVRGIVTRCNKKARRRGAL
jgi:hypothetical protein